MYLEIAMNVLIEVGHLASRCTYKYLWMYLVEVGAFNR